MAGARPLLSADNLFAGSAMTGLESEVTRLKSGTTAPAAPSPDVRLSRTEQDVTHAALASRAAARHDPGIMPLKPSPPEFIGVTVVAKANVYFDGNVISHTVLFKDDTKKTLGLIRPGSYHFSTSAPERMEIIAGDCRVTLDGSAEEKSFARGTFFDVPANSGFTIAVENGLCEYICSFLGK
jgi:purine/pyrimidine-nucleoside phosphorylase